jgi:hypothetical protein
MCHYCQIKEGQNKGYKAKSGENSQTFVEWSSCHSLGLLMISFQDFFMTSSSVSSEWISFFDGLTSSSSLSNKIYIKYYQKLIRVHSRTKATHCYQIFTFTTFAIFNIVAVLHILLFYNIISFSMSKENILLKK